MVEGIITALIILLIIMSARTLTVYLDRHLLIQEIEDSNLSKEIKRYLIKDIKSNSQVLSSNLFHHTEVNLFKHKITYFRFISYRISQSRTNIASIC